MGNAVTQRRPGRPLTAEEKRIRAVTAKWIAGKFGPKALVYGVTLTCKQALPNDGGGLTRLTRTILVGQLRIFLKRLDQKIYKSAYRRGTSRLRRVSAIEGGEGTEQRLHIHMLIQVPSPGRVFWWDFMQLIANEWRGLPWSDWVVDIDACPDLTATGYYLGKTGADAMEWETSEL